MRRPETTRRRWALWPMVWITAVLVAGAGAIVPWLLMALHEEDIEALESPLLLSVARQLESGPRGLYGPYTGRYPLVLIHAPLYYRTAALVGWSIRRAGLKPVPASLIAGRLISALGLLATFAAAYRLARLGGMPTRAGAWAALLVAGTPIHGGVAFEVRPDMLGIGLQTTGILLMLSGLVAAPIRESRLTAGFGCFALAACVKQQYVIAPLFSLFLMLRVWRRGRLALAPIGRCVFFASAVVSVYYGAEEWITGGRMSESVFVAARNVGRAHPADWSVAGNLLLALVWKCVGLILLLAAAGMALVSARPGQVRRAFAIAATILIALLATLAIVQFFVVEMRVSFLIVIGLIVVIVVVIPASMFAERSLMGDRFDATLWAYCAGELALTLVLWRLSTGAWFNYALQAVIVACVLTARALSRALERPASWRPLIPAALAALAVPAFAFTEVKQVLARRAAESAALTRVLEQPRRPAAEIFFVDRPGANRVHGRIDLVYDPWLYPVFESIGLAEPRSIWLDRALSTGPVGVIAATSSRTEIEGLKRPLPDLGYILAKRVGPYFVWVRQPVTSR